MRVECQRDKAKAWRVGHRVWMMQLKTVAEEENDIQ